MYLVFYLFISGSGAIGLGLLQYSSPHLLERKGRVYVAVDVPYGTSYVGLKFKFSL